MGKRGRTLAARAATLAVAAQVAAGQVVCPDSSWTLAETTCLKLFQPTPGVSWDAALAACTTTAPNAHLATLLTPAVIAASEVFGVGSGTWIGLKRVDTNGSWAWITGEPLVFGGATENFADRQPNSPTARCGEIVGTTNPSISANGKWNDLWCGDPRSYLCSVKATASPTRSPTNAPTRSPTKSPTPAPSNSPTLSPSKAPTRAPTPPTKSPTKTPTTAPTILPDNVCTAADATAWAPNAFDSDVSHCVVTCELAASQGGPVLAHCVAGCLSGRAGVTGACSLCYGIYAECMLRTCKCDALRSDSTCATCSLENCEQSFTYCAGPTFVIPEFVEANPGAGGDAGSGAGGSGDAAGGLDKETIILIGGAGGGFLVIVVAASLLVVARRHKKALATSDADLESGGKKGSLAKSRSRFFIASPALAHNDVDSPPGIPAHSANGSKGTDATTSLKFAATGAGRSLVPFARAIAEANGGMTALGSGTGSGSEAKPRVLSWRKPEHSAASSSVPSTRSGELFEPIWFTVVEAYEAEYIEELSVALGEKIKAIGQADQRGEWYECENKSGQQGLVPAASLAFAAEE